MHPLGIILAAGQGKRMNSDLAKVLHPACGKSLVEHVLDAARSAGVPHFVVIVGHQGEAVRRQLAQQPGVEFAEQTERLGTGHAVMMARSQLAAHSGPVLVLAGDTPLLRSESLRALLDVQCETGAACVVGTARTAQNYGLGRIVRDANGHFLRIVEEKDATPDERRIEEINTGCFVFDAASLLKALGEVRTNNQQGEYYLTDCAGILRGQGARVEAACRLEIAEAMGVNTPEQLADVERVMRERAESSR
jgi:bifunctional UDP-N-acetylglucosamine pyrophosphorylase/glucosamine-1-phosphate N-acetyltransferase